MGQLQKTNKDLIKDGLMSNGALALFADNLPDATRKHGKEAAKRFAKMVFTSISQNAALQKCSVPSIVKAASISASLNLDIDPRGLAYLVPYGTECNFQIGYMGLIELAYRSGKVKSIAAHCVYASEKSKITITRTNGEFQVDHPFSYEKPTGDMIAVYATAQIEGYGTRTLVLRKDEVDRCRNISKAKNSPAWKDHYEAMAKKTAVRQLCKFLPKSIIEDFSRGAAYDNREDFEDTAKRTHAALKEESGQEVTDVSFEAHTAPDTAPPEDVPTEAQEEDFLND